MLSAEQDLRRLSALQRLGALEMSPSKQLDRVARLASQSAGAPLAFVSVLNLTKVWFLACAGQAITNVERADSFCTEVVESGQTLWVQDATLDPRFSTLPVVAGALSVRFYCGVPIRAANGVPLGAVCVLDRFVRQYDQELVAALDGLAEYAAALFDKETTGGARVASLQAAARMIGERNKRCLSKDAPAH